MSTFNAWPLKTTNQMKAFFWSSCFLAFAVTLTLIFKAISDHAWDHPPWDHQSLDLRGAEGTDADSVRLTWSALSDRISSAISWASISLGGLLAGVSLWASLHAKTRGPIHVVFPTL